MSINRQARANVLSVANHDNARRISEYAKEKQSHLWKPPTELEVIKVLTAMASFTEDHGKEFRPKYGPAHRIEWEECCCGFRFEMWAL